MEPGARAVFVSILYHMERGWQAFRRQRAWFEQNSEYASSGSADYAKLLDFVSDLSDVFFLIGVGMADLVPGWPGWEAEADPADVDAWADWFSRDLAVFRLACTSADVRDPFRVLALSVVGVLESGRWAEQLSVLLAAVGELDLSMEKSRAVSRASANDTRPLG